MYIDGRLKNQLDTNVFPDLEKNDKDAVFIVDGKERSGKSKFTDYLGAYASTVLKVPYGIDSFCMNPQSFRDKIIQAKPKSIIIYDEAHKGMASARSLSEINNILKDLMMEMGQKNLFVVLVLPTFFLLDKYAALFRARGLFHIYELKKQRGFWVYFNEKNKLRLYKGGKKEFDYNCIRWPYFRGRFYNQYAVDEQEYRAKKAKGFAEHARTTRDERYLLQRNILLSILSKEFKKNDAEIEQLCKKYNWEIKRRTICDITKGKRKDLLYES